MSEQIFRILSLLTHAQLSSMLEKAVNEFNLYEFNNGGKDDIGGDIAQTFEEMSSDIEILERAVNRALIVENPQEKKNTLDLLEFKEHIEDLPF